MEIPMTPKAEEMFAKAIHLPQIPHLMREIVASLKNDDVTTQELAALVSNDMVISAKVLRLANSSFYGSRHDVSRISDAVQMIGLTSFRNLVIASAMSGMFPKVEGFDLASFWRNSMLVANLAHIIGRNLGEDRDALFTTGLMHSIGQLLIYLCLPQEAQAAAEACEGIPLEQQRAVEQSILNMDHYEVGKELARRWNFPDTIQSAIGNYDSPPDDDIQGQVVYAAVKIAKAIVQENTLDDMMSDLPRNIAERLHLDKAWFEEQGEVFDLLLNESHTLV
jgi:HD-like signal output (HDOD) protein